MDIITDEELKNMNFFVNIIDGYFFRHMIGVINNEIDKMSIVITEKEIKTSFLNECECGVYNINLSLKKMDGYIYDFKDEKGKKLNEHHFQIETDDLHTITKNLGKKDSFSLYFMKNDSRLSIRINKNSTKDTKSNNVYYINTINGNEPLKTIDIEYDKDPNVRLNTKEFSDICSSGNFLKCNFLEIEGYDDCVSFKGYDVNDHVKFVSDHKEGILSNIQRIKDKKKNNQNYKDDLDVENKKSIIKIKVPIRMIKSLSKMHNLSTHHYLSFYFKSDQYIKLMCHIGNYGKFIVFVKSYEK